MSLLIQYPAASFSKPEKRYRIDIIIVYVCAKYVARLFVIEYLWESSVLHSATIAAALVSSTRLTPPYQINNSQPSASTGNPNDQGISNASTSSCTASAATFNYATAAPRKYHGIGIKKIKKDNFDVGSVVSPVHIF